MAGSEFAKELIRENFPETTPNSYWAKSHIILDWELTKKLIDVGTKVFVIISDPRDITLNLNFFDNGMHISEYDYEMFPVYHFIPSCTFAKLRTIYVLLIQTVLWTYNKDKGIISNDINKTLSLDSFT